MTKSRDVVVITDFLPGKVKKKKMNGIKILYAKDVAKTLDCTTRTVTRLAEAYRDSGGTVGIRGFQIPGSRIWRFREDDISRLIPPSIPADTSVTSENIAQKRA